MPRTKKDSSVRRRSNQASTRRSIPSDAKIDQRSRPNLPRRYEVDPDTGKKVQRRWDARTLDWWRDLWAAPMATQYHPSDRHALFLLADLMDDFFTATSPKGRKDIAGEIRLQRQAFGLTPYDRLRLEWTIEATDEAKDRGERRRQGNRPPQPAPNPDPSADPRSVLHLA